MTKRKQPKADIVSALRSLALALPEVEEGVSCDKAAFKAGGKAFLFVGSGDAAATIMLKLGASLPEAQKLAVTHPATYKVGGHDWVTIVLLHNLPPPTELFDRWIKESYRLLVPKKLAETLDCPTAQEVPRRKAYSKQRSPKKSTLARPKQRSSGSH